jgi:hypothetical protein
MANKRDKLIVAGKVKAVGRYRRPSSDDSFQVVGAGIDGLIASMSAEIEQTIAHLDSSTFTPDPIAGRKYSRIASVVSSAYKRHGFILEQAILKRLRQCPHLQVWNEDEFQISELATRLLGQISGPEEIFSHQVEYAVGKSRSLQIDAVVYDNRSRILRSYEIKRGSAYFDAGKRRSMLNDVLCTQTLLASYGKHKGLRIAQSFSHVVFWYGKMSLKPPFGVRGKDLDSHFDWPVYDAVEEVNRLFRDKLMELLDA